MVRHAVPATVLWLPVLINSATAVYAGSLLVLGRAGRLHARSGQIMALVLTLWFFVTPICYPESAKLSPAISAVVRLNPLYVLVRGYRAVFLEGHAPELYPLLKLWAIALALFS